MKTTRRRGAPTGDFVMRAGEDAAPAVGMDSRTLAGLMRYVRRSAAAGPQRHGASGGRDGDTRLAHVNPGEEVLLKTLGGRGTVNPATGLREFAVDRNAGSTQRGQDRGQPGGSSVNTGGGRGGGENKGGANANPGQASRLASGGAGKASNRPGGAGNAGTAEASSLGGVLAEGVGDVFSLDFGKPRPSGKSLGSIAKMVAPFPLGAGMTIGEAMMRGNEAMAALHPDKAFTIDGAPGGVYVDGKVYSNANLASHQVNMMNLMSALQQGKKDVRMADITGHGVGGGETKGAAGEAGPGSPVRSPRGALTPAPAPVDPTDETVDLVFRPYQGDALRYAELPGAAEHVFFPNGAVPGVFG